MKKTEKEIQIRFGAFILYKNGHIVPTGFQTKFCFKDVVSEPNVMSYRKFPLKQFVIERRKFMTECYARDMELLESGCGQGWERIEVWRRQNKIAYIFGTHLKQLRSEIGVTQAKTARKTKVDKNVICGIEGGFHKTSLDDAILLADYFDVSLDYLVGRTDTPKVCAKNE